MVFRGRRILVIVLQNNCEQKDFSFFYGQLNFMNCSYVLESALTNFCRILNVRKFSQCDGWWSNETTANPRLTLLCVFRGLYDFRVF